MRTLWTWAAAAAAVVAMAACGSGGGYGSSGGSPAPAPAQCTAASATALGNGAVSLAGMAFSPACARVAPGSSVTFRNDDSTAHTVTADSGAFDHLLQPGQQVSITFGAAGTIAIHCTIHAGMQMTLFVQ